MDKTESASEQLREFDSLFRAILSVPKDKVDKEMRRAIAAKKKKAAQKRAHR